MTKKIVLILSLCTVGLAGTGFWIFMNSSSRSQKEQAVTSKSSVIADVTDIDGSYVSKDEATASVAKHGDGWRITYDTQEGQVFADFKTDWKEEGEDRVSSTQLTKSDGHKEFTINVKIKNWKKSENPLIVIRMSDGTSAHDMTFANQKDYFSQEDTSGSDAILSGDLTAFAGTYSNDALEKEIADSGFTKYAYQSDDYYQNRTNVFPTLSKTNKTNNEWTFWSGSTHAQYKLNTDKKARRVGEYYEVYFVGVNSVATSGQELVLTFIPQNATGPDGSNSSENRILYGQSYYRPYQDGWWKTYQSTKKLETDLDISAIESGDFTSLAGTWQNGQGNKLVINSDGSTSDGGRISAVPNSSTTSSVPYVSLQQGATGVALGLFKIGFQNPSGDQSDSSRPRLVIAQQAGNYAADKYYYRQ